MTTADLDVAHSHENGLEHAHRWGDTPHHHTTLGENVTGSAVENTTDPEEDRPTRTYRERREARAERLRSWADKRAEKAEASFSQAESISDRIPMGQPILVGHHSERRHRRDLDRIDSGMRRGFEHERKAENMRSRAEGIESQLDHSIYSDDPDAIERLRERIADLEAERDAIKAYNASCRKGAPDASGLSEKRRRDLAVTIERCSNSLGPNGQFPSYVLANLNGNINRNRKRLAALERRRGA